MRARTLVILGLTLLAGGCFSEPSGVEGSSTEGSTTSATSRTTSGDSADSSTSGPDVTSGTGSTSEPGTSTGSETGSESGDSSSGSGGEQLDCKSIPPVAAEPAELEADIIIMVDPDVDVAWGALQVSINAAVEQGANVAVLLHAAQNEELPDPPCLSCGGASCGNDVPVLKVVYELESVFTALSFNDISCIFDDAPGLPRTRHYWLFTDDLTQSVSAEFAGAVSDSNARFHVSSPGGMSPAQGSQLAELVEATFGGEGETDSAAALADQMRFVGSRRLACAWTVDPVPDTLPFFFLSNEYISSKTSDEGVIGTPIGGPLNCDNRADPKAGVAEAPFEFYYQEVDSTPVAVACPIACAFIQLEPADDTVLADVYCIEPE